jgi:hypothetical protein
VNGEMSRRSTLVSALLTPAILLSNPWRAEARLESVNRPDLLPEEKTHVIQTEVRRSCCEGKTLACRDRFLLTFYFCRKKFLTSGQARRMDQLLTQLESSTGYRVYVLCQNYVCQLKLFFRTFHTIIRSSTF